jgi:very-short-patch-repair endonuclease
MMNEQALFQPQRERLLKVFEFLKAYTELRYPPVRDIAQQLRVLWLKSLPQHPSVEIFQGDRGPDPDSEDAGVILRITRPDLTDCPSPPAALAEWLKAGWQSIDGSVDVHPSRNIPAMEGGARVERFEEAPQRPSLLKRWQEVRAAWQTNERPARQSLGIFQTVYEWFGIHEREAERIEILVGDGLLNCPDDGGSFNHPVLLQKLELEFRPEKKHPQFVFRKRDQMPELYLEFLRALPEANHRQIALCGDELRKAELSPLGGKDTEGFFQRLIQGVFPAKGQALSDITGAPGQLSAKPHPPASAAPPPPARDNETVTNPQNITDAALEFEKEIARRGGDVRALRKEAVESKTEGKAYEGLAAFRLWQLNAREESPANQTKNAGPTIRRDPVIFIRQRRSGPGAVFELVLEDIAKRVDFPAALLQIVGLAGDALSFPEEDSASVSFGNENEEVLLRKPANKEQLEIARQLARRDCVLVQGPPGTGKTHTIANLLGHLLANGKRVLVTAHTPKALRVLREKVVEALQPLCISVLQNDKQSQDDLEQSVRQIAVRLSQDAHELDREAGRLKLERKRVIDELREARIRLLDARQDEIRGVVFGGKDIRPTDAAKRVKQGVASNDWVPGPVNLGEIEPLSHAEIVTLYQTNARVSLEDERELNAGRPDVVTLPTPKEFSEVVEEIAAMEAQNICYREELWDGARGPQDLAEFDRMLALATKAIEYLRNCAPWQLEAVQAGRDGNEAIQVWISLTELIESGWKEVQECQILVMALGPLINDQRPPHELLPIVDEIIQHIESGKSFGLVTRLTKPACHQLTRAVRIGSRSPILNEPTHFRAVRALLRIQIVRQELVDRWERQIAAQDGPASSELGERPEQVCRQFISLIETCIKWHSSTWLTLEAEFHRLGFKWSMYYESTPPVTGSNAELRRLRNAVLGELERILEARAGWLRLRHLMQVRSGWCSLVARTNKPDAAVTQRLRQSLLDGAPAPYREAHNELVRLKNLEPEFATRQSLLDRLGRAAPAWASAIQNRHPLHSMPQPAGDPLLAWEWRQLHDELERRANVSLDELQQRIERFGLELLDITSQLVEKLTWASLIRQTHHEQKQALGAYAAMRKKLTKSGKGVQDADMRAGARREMTVAKGAVPVWIMPLNEVAETFDPRTARFDVVIIDEASQCDPTAMFALYLGHQTIIVGDDEQVTPVAVGVEMEQVQRLIQVHLQGIPHRELYDGQFSIYEFAQIAFGGVIRLVEHFRCAPNIIAFSNTLSYKGEIKPLREASTITLYPHVLPYRLEGGRGGNDGVNDAEAEVIASLICAAIEQPEYGTNEAGKPTSFGVVSLVGAQQSLKVDGILRQRLEPAEYKLRQILCGDAAQFQGDERDVMFLSVVDAPPPEPPLPMRREGQKNIFKKRFNVAASRARDQMWVVYSLNHEIDLKPGDYRRRLIEHAIDPTGWERELERLLPQVDARSKEFEGRVLRRLLESNFRVFPQYRVGGYRIDLVVTGGGKRLAVECDGESTHGPEKLQEDMERQAILERLGWQFVRIRGSIFFRDEERALRPLFQRLEELGITADLEPSPASSLPTPNAVTQRVIRRAQELRAAWQDERLPTDEAEHSGESHSSRTRRDGES